MVFFTKLSFVVFIVRFFFLLNNFLLVEDHEFSQSTSHLLSVLLTLEDVRILSWSISSFSTSIVSLMVFCEKLLSELMILVSTHHVAKHLTCRNKLRKPLLENIYSFHQLLFNFEMSRFGT